MSRQTPRTIPMLLENQQALLRAEKTTTLRGDRLMQGGVYAMEDARTGESLGCCEIVAVDDEQTLRELRQACSLVLMR